MKAHVMKAQRSATLMKNFVLRYMMTTLAITLAVSVPQSADARRGGFLSALIAVGRAGANAGAPGYTTKSYTDDVLTPEQLENCVVKAKQLDEESARVEERAAAVTALSSEIEGAQLNLETARQSVTSTSRASVNAFNAKIEDFNARVEIYQAEVNAYNELEARLGAVVDAYNATCTKKYYVDDMQMIKTKLGFGAD